MARFIVEVAEVHYTSYEVEGDDIITPEQARREVFSRGEMIDNSTTYSHLLGTDHKVYQN